jgi:hypothetical protein
MTINQLISRIFQDQVLPCMRDTCTKSQDDETIPGQKKEEAITLESAPSSVQTSPEQTRTPLPEKKPTAIYVPTAATQSSKSAAPPVDANAKAVIRTMVEASRQASIQRTSTPGPGKGPQPKLQICAQVFLVEYGQIVQDGYEIPIFQEYRSIRTYYPGSIYL